MNKNNYENSVQNAFNRCIAFQYIIDSPKTINELCDLMYTYPTIIWEHCKWFQNNGFVTSSKRKGNEISRAVLEFTAVDIDDFPWSKIYLKSKDPRRDYFNQNLYPHLESNLRDAIYEGRISKDVVKQYNRENTVKWELNYKSNFHGNFQSSINGIYNAQ